MLMTRMMPLCLLFTALVAGPAVAQNQLKEVPGSGAEVQLSFAPLVKRASPAVVNIYTAKTVRVRRFAPLFDDPFFQQFFGRSMRRALPGPQKKVQNSLGSGVLVAADGLIVTNHHVIEGAEEIKVVLSDRREFEARIIGTDERTDLAVLKVDTKGEALAHLQLSDSDRLEVGDLVLAIGNPFGVGQTVTSGIVSALARTGVGISDLNSFIQTDAAINPGNSGGALVSMNGHLVGINTAIFSRSGGSLGIGFAIPSNMVRTVVKGIQAGGRAVRPWFGASGQRVTALIAENIGLSRPYGVMITSLYQGGPAERGGLQQGDVVLEIAGHEIQDPQELRFRIAILSPGGKVNLNVWRGGRTVSLNLPLELAPEVPPRKSTVLKGRHPIVGATIANLSPALAEEMGMDMTSRGVIILDVGANSSAAQFGFKAGDILKEVNAVPITSVKGALKQLMQMPKSWRITVNRDGRDLSLVIRL
ncbi:MAG: Do family serine endopeptidase [Rhodospirillaceae bacterium]|nr:Do family serine endopeptidase [Rhodospirillaceae bacterium]